MASFSVLDALDILYTSIPQWNTRLDDLNGQIALRQIELARLEESEGPRPASRSLKNKGSTESLRPRDGGENPFGANETSDDIPVLKNPFDTPKSPPNGYSTPRRTSSSIARAAAGGAAIANANTKSQTRQSPSSIERQLSASKSPTQGQPNGGRNVLRKRKTESLASGESAVPKFRTRSMIIIYYDGEVQRAFEDLVKFVSGSRNSMRKGKMAAKMAEMKRAAEKEVEEEEDLDEEDDMLANGNLVVGQKKIAADPLAVGSDNGDDDDEPMPKLKFVSTRNMGPRNMVQNAAAAENVGSTLSLGLLRGYRRGAADSLDIFDELDKGLEWCQAQCEHGAHNFLREGDCGTEITNIKKKLSEIQTTALKEMERLKEEGAAAGNRKLITTTRPEAPKPRGRELKQPQLRREYNAPKELEVDDMEVDDEGVDDLQLPSKLVFKRSGQV